MVADQWPAAATRERLLRVEVVEERSFRDTGGGAQVVDGGRAQALGADDGDTGIEQASNT